VPLAQGTGLTLDVRQGVWVGERMETDVAGVFAAGAVAAMADRWTGRREARGQWYFAFQQGRLAGATMMGARVDERSRAGALGSFWHATQVEGLSVLLAGAPLPRAGGQPTGAPETSGGPGWHRRVVLAGERLVGYLAVGGAPPAGLAVKRLIDERIDVRPIARQLLIRDFDLRAFITQQRLEALTSGEHAAVRQPSGQPARSSWAGGWARPAIASGGAEVV
jgi:hypothetical protein